jgi:predicted ATP-binding protein involved in virulence
MKKEYNFIKEYFKENTYDKKVLKENKYYNIVLNKLNSCVDGLDSVYLSLDYKDSGDVYLFKNCLEWIDNYTPVYNWYVYNIYTGASKQLKNKYQLKLNILIENINKELRRGEL